MNYPFIGIIFILIALIRGYFISTILIPDTKKTIPFILLKAFLGIGFGIGSTSILYFLWIVIHHHAGPEYRILELAATLIVIIASVIINKNRLTHNTTNQNNTLTRPLNAMPYGKTSLLIIVGLLTLILISGSMRVPKTSYGALDAMAIWNLHARFLYRSDIPGQWKNYLSNKKYADDFFREHPDYPLMLPCSVAGYWECGKDDSQRIPHILAVLFLIGLAGTLAFGLYCGRSGLSAIIALVAVFKLHIIFEFASYQISDIPLTYFILSTLVLGALYFISERKYYTLLIALGIMAGLAGWTKNEGLAFCVIVLFSLPLALLFTAKPSHAVPEIWHFAAGVLPVMAVILFFKLVYAPSNDVINESTLSVLFQKLFSSERHLIILKFITSNLYRKIQRSHMLIISIIYILVLGINKKRISSPVLLMSVAAPPVMLALVYYIIYLITPRNLQWHLASSFDRLYYHILPQMVFVVFFFITIPEHILSSYKNIFTKQPHTTTN